MAVGKPVVKRRRKQQRLVDCVRQKILTHHKSLNPATRRNKGALPQSYDRHTPRRDVLAGLAASSAAAIAQVHGDERQSSGGNTSAVLSNDERRRHAKSLLNYFASVGTQLLRAPDGLLKHPSIAQTTPGKQYSTQLWDWDTLWTSRGLCRLAVLEHDEPLKQKLCEHVSGSLLNFLEHASPEGQIPIMMTADNPDAFRVLGKNSISKNHSRAFSVLL
jgi:hypothetical protein